MDRRIETAIGEALGYAAVCWIPKPTGEFDANSASAAVDHVLVVVNEVLRERDEEIAILKETVRLREKAQQLYLAIGEMLEEKNDEIAVLRKANGILRDALGKGGEE